VSEGIGKTGGDVGVGIRRRVVQIQRKGPHLSAIVRIAAYIGYTPAGKQSQA